MKKIRMFCLALCVSLFMTACGKGDITDGNDNNIFIESNAVNTVNAENSFQGPEWVYVPEFIEVRDERVDYGRMQLIGDSVCYITIGMEEESEERRICRYSLSEKELIRIPIDWPMEEKERQISSYIFNPDHSVWMIIISYSADFSQIRRFLCKFDPEGKNLVSQEVTEHLERNVSIRTMAVDEQGRIYVFTDEATIYLYTSDGAFEGRLSYGSLENVQVKGTVNGNDGRFYVCISTGEGSDHCALMEVDFEKGQITELIEDFPNINGFCTDPTGRYDFILYDDIFAYGYNLSTQKAEELFVWGDSDVNGYYVRKIGVLEDGRYFCTVEDWMNEDRSMVLLARTRTEEAPRRENIVLATVDGGGDMTALAVRFNRSSDQYHLTLKNFDSLTDLYNALLAKETIDLIDLSGVDVKKLSRQGVFADLTPYLEQSEDLGPSDFLDGILETYTFDGTLVGIPETFTLRTVAGDRTLLGGEGGLSLDGMLAAAEQNPGAQPFGDMIKEEMMQYIMMFNEEAFIDWEKGECHFDSAQFTAVLELCRCLPSGDTSNERSGYESEYISKAEEESLPTKIQNGEVLFAIADLRGLDDFQLYEGMFGENAAAVGFPTPEGKGGTLLFPKNAYGIVAGSENKSGAWEFIESVLTQVNAEELEKEEVYEEYSLPSRFPALKSTMDIIIEYILERDSQRASDHFPGRIFEDGWFFRYRAISMEDANLTLDLIKEAVPAFSVENDDILNIINEEAFAYYSGQKRVEDAVSIIQNRIQLYVRENS